MRVMRSQPGVIKAEYRGEQRLPLGRPGTLRRDGQDQVIIRIADLTREGCRIEVDDALLPDVLSPDEHIVIGMAGIGSIAARVVRRSASGYGCVFLHALSPGAVSAAFENNVVALPGSTDSAESGFTDAPGAMVQPRSSLHHQAVHPAISPRVTIAVVAAISAAGWALVAWGVMR